MQKITTYLWFNHQAEEAANFYTSLFDNSRVLEVQRHGKGGPGPEQEVMLVTFELAGQRFIALNGGPEFTFSEAISLYVDCRDQAEVDELWAKLVDGGQPGPCGWLKDRYGVSWQVIPEVLPKLLTDPDPEKARRAAEAMFKMQKIDVQALQDAHAGR